MNLEDFTADALRPHVGSQFHVKLDDGQTFALMLEEVKVGVEKHVSPRKTRDSFSLFFVGPQNVHLRQLTYAVSHDVLGGPWDIFIVPVGRRENSYLYEAVFT